MRPFYGWWLVAVCVLYEAVGFGTSLFMYSVVAGAMSKELAGTRSELMFGATALIIATALLSPWIGRVADRAGVRTVLVVGAVALGVGFIALSRCSAIWQVWLCYSFLIAAGMACLGPLTAAILISRWFHRRRGLALGIASLGTGLGGFIFPPLVASAIAAFGWRTAIAGLGAGILATLPAILYRAIIERPAVKGLAPDGGAAPTRSHEDVTGLAWGGGTQPVSLWADRNFVLLVFAIGGATAVNLGMVSQLSLIATDLGLPAARGALLLSVASLAGMLSSPFVGRFCDTAPPKLVAAVLFGCGAGALALFMDREHFTTLLCAAALLGAAAAGVKPFWAYLAGRLYSAASYGRVMGLSSFVVFAITAAAPLGAGWLYDRTGSHRALLVVLITVMITAVVLIMLLRVPTVRAASGPHEAAI